MRQIFLRRNLFTAKFLNGEIFQGEVSLRKIFHGETSCYELAHSNGFLLEDYTVASTHFYFHHILQVFLSR